MPKDETHSYTGDMTHDAHAWQPDVLGPGFAQRTIPLGEDDEGPLVATLVRSLPGTVRFTDRLAGRSRIVHPLAGVDVLYVHGWSDYFFQRELAAFFTGRGARFFALDLRKYGRSLRPGQTPGFIEDLAQYDAEIGAALEIMGAEPANGGAASFGGRPRRLLLMGHSTGGLILSLWADRHPGVASGLLLNSPWLEFQLPGRIRASIAPLVDLSARFNPRESAPQLDFGYYTRAQRAVADADHPLEVNTEWRPEQAMAVHAGWLRAILRGHSEVVERGLRITAPVGVLLSRRWISPLRWSEELTSVDSVLDVDEIARAATRLGPTVTIERIDGALHDVFLSRPGVREEAYRRLEAWLRGWIAEIG